MGAFGGRHFAAWPAIPANNATIVLFTTHDRVPTGGTDPVKPSIQNVHPHSLDAVTVTFHRHNKASAANGLRAYVLDNTGTWRETDLKDDSGAATIGSGAAIQVPILAAPAEHREKFVTSGYLGFALEYTAGADNPEEWNGTICAEYGMTAVQR
jgi:hypothetical protein